MKNFSCSRVSFSVAGFTLAAMSSFASAGTVTTHYTPFQSGNGGEFRIVGSTAGMHSQFSDITSAHAYNLAGGDGSTLGYAAAADFQSFCLERNETIGNGSTYSFSIDTAAIRGGLGGQNPVGSGQDPIGNATAFLYRSFRLGTLSNYAYNGAGTNASQIAGEGFSIWSQAAGTGNNNQEARRERAARTLQTAIWFLEGELPGLGSVLPTTVPAPGSGNNDPNPNALNQAEWDQLIAWVNAGNAARNGDYGVRALNLWTDRAGGTAGVYDAGIDTLVQSQLTLIPLPTAAGLGLAGMGGLALRRRRTA